MKRTLFLLAAVFSMAATFSSCEKPKDEEKNKSDKVYTDEEQKEKLQDVATEFMSKFNPEDQRKAVALSDYLTRLYEDYDWDFSDLENLYKGDYGFLCSVNRDVHRAVFGDPTSNFATDLLAKATKSGDKTTEIYKFANINAVWEANETEHKWEYKGEGNGGLVLKFKGPKGVQCEAKLWGEDGTITYKGTYEVPTGKYYIRLNEREVRLPDDVGKEYYGVRVSKRYEYEGEKYWVYHETYNGDYYYIDVYDKYYVSEENYGGSYEYNGNYYWVYREYEDQPFEATLPNQVNFYLKEGATEHISYAMKFDVQKSDHFNFDYTLKITNLTIAQGLKASKNAFGCVFSAKLGNEDLIKTVVDGKNCGLVDKANNQDWVDWLDMYGEMMFDDYTLKTGPGIAQVDILGGKLTIKTSTTDAIKFLKDWSDLEDKYPSDYNNWWESYYWQSPYNKEFASLLNKFMKVDLYYGDSRSVQAQMKWEATYYDDEDWNGNTHQIWDCEPMIYFPVDETSYNFGKYFTEKRFNTVINTAEEFVKKYIRLSERWGDRADDIDF